MHDGREFLECAENDDKIAISEDTVHLSCQHFAP
jgi:hypothetical protein